MEVLERIIQEKERKSEEDLVKASLSQDQAEKIAALEKMLEDREHREKQTEEDLRKAQAAEQKAFQTKRSADLARNKISTATECLDMYLKDNLKDPKFDEFSPAYQFLVTQYAALLFTPDLYTINPDTNQITLSENLFSKIDSPDSQERLVHFKDQLKLKLQHDQSVRRERRNSITGIIRPRGYSGSKRAGSDTVSSSIPKSVRVNSPPSTKASQ